MKKKFHNLSHSGKTKIKGKNSQKILKEFSIGCCVVGKQHIFKTSIFKLIVNPSVDYQQQQQQ